MKATSGSTESVDIAQLRHSLRATFDSAPVCMVTTNPDLLITFANRQAASFFGLPQDALIGKELEQTLQQIGCGADIGQVLRQSSESHSCECEVSFESPASRSRKMKITKSTVTTEGQDAEYVYFFQPHHGGGMSEVQVVEIDRMLTRGEMAAEIAHEMNNFLTILIGNTELIPLFINNNDHQKALDKLSVMKGTLGKIADLSESLIEYGKPHTMRTITNLNEMIESTIKFFSPQNRFDGIEIRTELSENLPPFKGDLGRLQQVIGDLVHNAADELKDADSEIKTIVIRTSSSSDGKFIIITVADTGRGIDETVVAKIFRERCSMKPDGEGYGLLACKKIVDVHRGTILFDDVLGRGTCFEIRLPITTTTSSASTETADAESIVNQYGQGAGPPVNM
ncbi:MAG: PAS domain-containing protein [candidate division Zixibacteria bacterium]|nr:PAS domain-containing protein [candidate division Zixibacteria bacterium]MBU1469635.1 PAS domain-containing protein [candidate division Zixibacteria bacterium]MBU2626144.1 PAS domain-containing protein [candidate division Zixibacteria bacterium]